tara:strand:- start:4 stop:150 length:147 start_codon:yes stop_codon:yes gene_type:complete
MNRDFFKEEGWDCFYSGGSEIDNPYPDTDARNHQWSIGFNDARFNSKL